MSAWTRGKKLDALVDLILHQHSPRFYADDSDSPGEVYRCACGDAGMYGNHLRQMIDNEGFIQDDPGVR